MKIAFFGSSLVSSYWNGAVTYYRGLIAALAERGCQTTFYEPDAFDRQNHRDIDPPDWARSVVYPASHDGLTRVLADARDADVIVKASGVGVFDAELLAAVAHSMYARAVRVFWDVDAPATLAELRADPRHMLRAALPRLDLVLTYGGGSPVVAAYERAGARRCVPIYNALDPATHHPAPPDPRFEADLAFLGNRLPDREARVDALFLAAARALPKRRFLIGGSGWRQEELPPNVRAIGHVSTRDHNAFNATPLAVINIARDSMADVGFSPATRVFEAAGAAACLITDAWEGIALFLEPRREVLVARDALDVARHLSSLTQKRAKEIGAAARRRILAEHTYDRRVDEVVQLLRRALDQKRGARAA